MINVRIKLLGVLRGLTGEDVMVLKLKKPTVRIAVEILSESLPRQARNLLMDRYLDDPRPNVLILLNGKEIGVLEGLETSLKDGDELTVIPVAHGG